MGVCHPHAASMPDTSTHHMKQGSQRRFDPAELTASTGRRIAMTEPTDTQPAFVSRFYEMDPDVDDLLLGLSLRDGMVVLLEDHLLRADEDRAHEKWELARLREVNRWCEVSDFSIAPRYGDSSGPLIEFIGIYPDGTKRTRRYAGSYAWLVRRFSLDCEVSA